jgi:hypothetical protein
MKRFFAVVVVLLVCSTAFAKSPRKKTPYRSKGTVTTVDLGGPAQTESPWPDVVKKGHL